MFREQVKEHIEQLNQALSQEDDKFMMIMVTLEDMKFSSVIEKTITEATAEIKKEQEKK